VTVVTLNVVFTPKRSDDLTMISSSFFTQCISLHFVHVPNYKDPYDRYQNPMGYVALCIAENKLITHRLVERCVQPGTAAAALADAQVYCYNSFIGMPVARDAAAYFLERWFLHPQNCSSSSSTTRQSSSSGSGSIPESQQQQSDSEPHQLQQHINPAHIALAAGAAAVLNNLFFVLGDVGDACLIPAPYYAAFENDMNLVSNIVPFAIHQANPMLGPSESELTLAYMQCKATGLNPRFLLLTNPHNPLAVIYRPNVMQRCVDWARKRLMHTIVDEIYALTTHQVNRATKRQIFLSSSTPNQSFLHIFRSHSRYVESLRRNMIMNLGRL
jgi:Aminotransferase class I and II